MKLTLTHIAAPTATSKVNIPAVEDVMDNGVSFSEVSIVSLRAMTR